MPEKSKNRIKSLSTRYLALFIGAGYVLITCIAGSLIAYVFFQVAAHESYLIFSAGQLIYFVYLWWKVNNNVYNVEFDDEFLYVILKKNDILIPLENVKDVNIKTLGGVWCVDFYHAEQLGDKIYFKPSLLYPFNSKKKDELVNILWSNIEKAKSKKQDFQRNALHS